MQPFWALSELAVILKLTFPTRHLSKRWTSYFPSLRRKNEIYIPTVVDRATHWVLSREMIFERSSANMEACLERAPQAKQYYREALLVYDTLYYEAPYEMRTDKKETYSVEAVNADLHYVLKCLVWKCRRFAHRLGALHKKMPFLENCYNRRQMMKRVYPRCSFHSIDFLCSVR